MKNITTQEKILQDRLGDFLNQKDNLENSIRNYVKDKSFPLKNRWEVFVCSRFGDQSCFAIDFGILNVRYWIENCHKERYSFIDIVDYIGFSEQDFKEEDLVEIKEKILESFVRSIELDW